MRQYVIIVAGGSGTRMGGSIPKQFLEVAGRPILMHTVQRFYDFDNDISIIVVLPADQIDFWKELCQQHNFIIPHTIVTGGETRFHSVLNGLQYTDEDSLIAVHDGVRPFVSRETLEKGFRLAMEKGTAIPVVQPPESIRIIEDNRSKSIDRSTVRLVQTPQIFNGKILHKAYEQQYTDLFTDDASVVEKAGFPIYLYDGNRENIKITTPDDLIYAEALCCSTSSTWRRWR